MSRLLHVPPRTILVWAVRSLYVTVPLTVFTFLAWALRWQWAFPDDRPFIVLMAYQGLLMLSGAGAGVALLAGCHMAIHDSFRAGLETGYAAAKGKPPPARSDRSRDPLLRLVGGNEHTT